MVNLLATCCWSVLAVANEIFGLYKRIHDFEDGLEYYSALQSGCEAIVTEDVDDFYFSDIPARRCDDFLAHFVFGI